MKVVTVIQIAKPMVLMLVYFVIRTETCTALLTTCPTRLTRNSQQACAIVSRSLLAKIGQGQNVKNAVTANGHVRRSYSGNQFMTNTGIGPSRKALDPFEKAIQTNTSNLDAMRARAALLRTSILKQQLELQKLEREIICCSQGQDYSEQNDPTLQIQRVFSTFVYSTNVLLRKLSRVQGKVGPSNQQWKSVGDYVASQTATGVRIVRGLVQNPSRLKYFVDPETPTLVPHVPAILARLDKLEMHVNPILERVLNNRRHLASIEPYLDDILERFDDIEPHLPWILDNIDALAPYCGLLLKHIDELLLYADADDYAEDNGYALAEQLLPYLEYYISRLDVIGPHLPLLRPHVPQLLRHNRIGNISPHIDRLFARGYQDLSASANMDVLLFWFGWTLRIPGLPRLFFALPGSPRIVSLLANRLPKRFVRGYCRGVTCQVDNDYGGNWNKLKKGT